MRQRLDCSAPHSLFPFAVSHARPCAANPVPWDTDAAVLPHTHAHTQCCARVARREPAVRGGAARPLSQADAAATPTRPTAARPSRRRVRPRHGRPGSDPKRVRAGGPGGGRPVGGGGRSGGGGGRPRGGPPVAWVSGERREVGWRGLSPPGRGAGGPTTRARTAPVHPRPSQAHARGPRVSPPYLPPHQSAHGPSGRAARVATPAFGLFFLKSELAMSECARRRRWAGRSGGESR